VVAGDVAWIAGNDWSSGGVIGARWVREDADWSSRSIGEVGEAGEFRVAELVAEVCNGGCWTSNGEADWSSPGTVIEDKSEYFSASCDVFLILIISCCGSWLNGSINCCHKLPPLASFSPLDVVFVAITSSIWTFISSPSGSYSDWTLERVVKIFRKKKFQIYSLCYWFSFVPLLVVDYSMYLHLYYLSTILFYLYKSIFFFEIKKKRQQKFNSVYCTKRHLSSNWLLSLSGLEIEQIQKSHIRLH
jgi:hypothetical protein